MTAPPDPRHERRGQRRRARVPRRHRSAQHGSRADPAGGSGESSEDAIITKTLEGVITTWNKGAERIFGYSRDEMIAPRSTASKPADRADDVSEILAAIGRGERVDHFESERVCKDGRRINVPLSVSPIRDRDGTIVGAAKIARDVTLQRRADEERQATVRRLGTVRGRPGRRRRARSRARPADDHRRRAGSLRSQVRRLLLQRHRSGGGTICCTRCPALRARPSSTSARRGTRRSSPRRSPVRASYGWRTSARIPATATTAHIMERRSGICR